MNTKRIIWALVLILIGLASARIIRCPSFQDMMEDCTCNNLTREVYCKDIINPNSLHSIMHILSDFPVSIFILSDSILSRIPSGLFKKVPIEALEIYNSEIFGWESENGSLMFEGIENSLKTIRMYNIKGMSYWKWSVFSTLKKLEYIRITKADIEHINNDFSLVSPNSLRKLYLDKANINSIHPEAFSHHEKLITLSLSENNIEEIKRSMLPNPAKELSYLILTTNKLKSLPKDMFIGMPSLIDISLENNTIQFLSEELFAPLIGREWDMFLTDNDLYCCTDMKWILNDQIQSHIIGKCKHPLILKEKKIEQLEDFDFTHGLC